MCRCPFVPRCRALSSSSSLYHHSRLATVTSSDVALSRGILLLWRTEDRRCRTLSSLSLYRRSRFATATSSDVALSRGLLLLWRTEDRRCVIIDHRSASSAATLAITIVQNGGIAPLVSLGATAIVAPPSSPPPFFATVCATTSLFPA